MAVICDSSGGDGVSYIPLLPDEQLLEDIFSIYEKRDFGTMYLFCLFAILGTNMSVNIATQESDHGCYHSLLIYAINQI